MQRCRLGVKKGPRGRGPGWEDEMHMLLGVLILLAGTWDSSHAQTAEQWFKLTVELQSRSGELDADERRFIKNVINRLSSRPDTVPTPDHRRWLLSLKTRLKLEWPTAEVLPMTIDTSNPMRPPWEM